jgi:hypothetical protein
MLKINNPQAKQLTNSYEMDGKTRRSKTMKNTTMQSMILAVAFLCIFVSLSKAQDKKFVVLDVPFQVALDLVNEKTGSRFIIIHLQQQYFDLCNLRSVLGQIRRNFVNAGLEVDVYTDLETLNKMVKFHRSRTGVPDFNDGEKGKKAIEEFYRDEYPKVIRGSQAQYYRLDVNDTVQEYIDYTPIPDKKDLVRVFISPRTLD